MKLLIPNLYAKFIRLFATDRPLIIQGTDYMPKKSDPAHQESLTTDPYELLCEVYNQVDSDLSKISSATVKCIERYDKEGSIVFGASILASAVHNMVNNRIRLYPQNCKRIGEVKLYGENFEREVFELIDRLREDGLPAKVAFMWINVFFLIRKFMSDASLALEPFIHLEKLSAERKQDERIIASLKCLYNSSCSLERLTDKIQLDLETLRNHAFETCRLDLKYEKVMALSTFTSNVDYLDINNALTTCLQCEFFRKEDLPKIEEELGSEIVRKTKKFLKSP
jgi:hypothetical protein